MFCAGSHPVPLILKIVWPSQGYDNFSKYLSGHTSQHQPQLRQLGLHQPNPPRDTRHPDKQRSLANHLLIPGHLREEQHHQMVFPMGLHTGVDAADQYTVVLYTELLGDCAVFERNGGHDIAENAT